MNEKPETTTVFAYGPNELPLQEANAERPAGCGGPASVTATLRFLTDEVMDEIIAREDDEEP